MLTSTISDVKGYALIGHILSFITLKNLKLLTESQSQNLWSAKYEVNYDEVILFKTHSVQEKFSEHENLA